MKRSHVLSLCISLPVVISACGQSGSTSGGGGNNGGSGGKPEQNTPENPAPGTVSDVAGFIVKLTGEASSLFSIHKDESTFSEKCEAKLGEKVTCVVDSSEEHFTMQDFNLHYHVPKSMCDYLTVRPYYFVNHKTKWQTSTLHTYVDRNGVFGIDGNNSGVIGDDPSDSIDIGCYAEKNEPVCCVGKYNWVKHSWNPEALPSAGYQIAEPVEVNNTMHKCVGGIATKTQPLSSFGVPIGSKYYVAENGRSEVYEIKGTDNTLIGQAGIVWNVNYFNAANHPATGGIPNALNYDIDPSAGVFRFGHPYYSFTCYDDGWEAKAEINVMLRDWNTKAAYENRVNAPNAYHETGFETTPFGTKPINDNFNWQDIEDPANGFGSEYLPNFDLTVIK